jgi:hypothetical protein
LLVPLQFSAASQGPDAGRHGTNAPATLSAGQLADVPLQLSARSQTPVAARHSVPDGTNSSVGHDLLEPSHVSARSQMPAALRQVVPTRATPSAGHAALRPVHVSATSQRPVAERQVVPAVERTSAGHVTATPLQFSAGSHGPVDGRHGAVLNLYFREWWPDDTASSDLKNPMLSVSSSEWDANMEDVTYPRNFPEDEARAFLKSLGEEELKIKLLKKINELGSAVVLDKKEDNTLDLTPNTVLITKDMVNNGFQMNNRIQNYKDQIVIFPKDYFCPKSLQTGKINKTENSFTIHHFAGSWIPKYKKVERAFWKSLQMKDYQILDRIKNKWILFTNYK